MEHIGRCTPLIPLPQLHWKKFRIKITEQCAGKNKAYSLCCIFTVFSCKFHARVLFFYIFLYLLPPFQGVNFQYRFFQKNTSIPLKRTTEPHACGKIWKQMKQFFSLQKKNQNFKNSERINHFQRSEKIVWKTPNWYFFPQFR